MNEHHGFHVIDYPLVMGAGTWAAPGPRSPGRSTPVSPGLYQPVL